MQLRKVIRKVPFEKWKKPEDIKMFCVSVAKREKLQNVPDTVFSDLRQYDLHTTKTLDTCKCYPFEVLLSSCTSESFHVPEIPIIKHIDSAADINHDNLSRA